MNIPSAYRIPQKTGLISGQCKQYTTVAGGTGKQSNDSTPKRNREGARDFTAQNTATNADTERGRCREDTISTSGPLRKIIRWMVRHLQERPWRNPYRDEGQAGQCSQRAPASPGSSNANNEYQRLARNSDPKG
ncbi:hypothetical protein BTHE68_40200 [Burkholderia sp. THE68]|nr:hypothetical protein BTHE68_40200 [Burkholderia sp. THE68]